MTKRGPGLKLWYVFAAGETAGPRQIDQGMNRSSTGADDEALRALVALLRGGDEQDAEGAFATLYHAVARRLYAFARKSGLAHDEAEDAVAETMAEVWKVRARRFGGQSQVMTWLIGILRHKLLDDLRRNRRSRKHELSADDEVEEMPADLPTAVDFHYRAEYRRAIDECLRVLPSRKRLVLHLLYYQERRCVEIAELLCAPEGTVKRLASEARAEVGRCLTRRGIVSAPGE
jgi:RNA polymerase sigma-70 factor (ECF subfamily)